MRQPGISDPPHPSRSPAPASSTRSSSTAPRTDAANVVGGVGDGWRVAMGTLAFERGASTLGQQLAFQHELDAIIAAAKANGAARDPSYEQRIAHALVGPARHAAAGPAHAVSAGARRALARGPGHQAVLGHLAPRPRQARHGRARPRRRLLAEGPGGGLRAHRAAAPVPVHPLRHHLRRLQRDPAQHHRRAGPGPPPSPSPADPNWPAPDEPQNVAPPYDPRPRPARAASAWSSPRRPAPASARPSPRRCVEEGATVLISDFHERRLGEAADALAGETRHPPVPRCAAT
jgi:hypothetical protein